MPDGAPSVGGADNPALGYSVRRQRVSIAGGIALDIRALLDRNQYHDPLGEAAAAGISPATWSLFGQVWPSARKLADLMQTWEIAGRRVLEIGCGLGLASLVIHRRLGDITASDCHPLTESFLRANLDLNGMPTLKYRTGHWTHANPGLGEFDLVIGSDVLYERSHPAQLAGFIALHAAPVAEVVIVDPKRGNRAAFTRAMALLGFALAIVPLDTPLDDGSPYHGQLLRYQRPAASATG